MADIKKTTKKADKEAETKKKPAVKTAAKTDGKKAPRSTDSEQTTKKPAVKKTTAKTDKFAVIETGGKQYLVAVGDSLKVEKLKGEEGDKLSFDKVLLISEKKEVNLGTPYLEKATVEATILEQGRAKKITVLRYKPKVRYKKKKGHRQPFTKIEITKI